MVRAGTGDATGNDLAAFGHEVTQDIGTLVVQRQVFVSAEAAKLSAGGEAFFEGHLCNREKLYGSVTASNIADALAEQGIEIDRRRILLDAPIRVLGEYPVRVRLHAGVISEVLVKVCPEGRLYEEDEVEAPAVANDAAEESAE